MRGKNQTKEGPPPSSNALDGLSLMQRGNEYFFSDCYLEATGYYYQAAMLLKTSPEHKMERSKAWSNVAECHLRLQNWQAAEDAASNAVHSDPTNSKALYRRAKARFELGDYKGAAKDADAVGTQDALDVAALCRELAHAEVARKLTNGSGGRERRERRHTVEELRDPSPILPPTESVEEREMWFRRIIDSYRLRVDDEYTRTGACDAGCLYGIRAKGLGKLKSPMDHFRAYVNRAIKKRVLPPWFTVGDMDELCHLATTDTFSNINIPVEPDDIVEFYSEMVGPHHDELKELRDLAVYIEGPIGMSWKPDKEPTEKPRNTPSPKVVLEPGLTSPSWGNRHAIPEPAHGRVVYDVTKKGRQPAAYGRYPSVDPQRRSGGMDPPQRRVPYPVVEKRESRHPPQQKAPGSPRHNWLARSQSYNLPTDKRTHYHYLSDARRRGQRSYEQQHQQQSPNYSTTGYHSPKRNKREQLGPGQGVKYQAHHNNPYGVVLLGDKRAPSPTAVTDSDSTSSELEQQSFGPQPAYSNLPGIPHQQSSRMMLARMSMMPTMESDDDEPNVEFYGKQRFGEFYSQEDTSTAQEVRHGLWRGGARDEFSELTELSP